jgi:hypothetical protein
MLVREQLDEKWDTERDAKYWMNKKTGEIYHEKPFICAVKAGGSNAEVTDLVKMRNDLLRKIEEARVGLVKLGSEPAAVRIQSCARGFVWRKAVGAWYFSDCVEVCYDRATGHRFFYDFQRDETTWELPRFIAGIVSKLALSVAHRATAGPANDNASRIDPEKNSNRMKKFGSYYQVLLISADLETSFLDGLAWECMGAHFNSSLIQKFRNSNFGVINLEGNAGDQKDKYDAGECAVVVGDDNIDGRSTSMLCLRELVDGVVAAIIIQSFWRSCTAQWVTMNKLQERYEKVWDDINHRYFYYDRMLQTSSWQKHCFLQKWGLDLADTYE